MQFRRRLNLLSPNCSGWWTYVPVSPSCCGLCWWPCVALPHLRCERWYLQGLWTFVPVHFPALAQFISFWLWTEPACLHCLGLGLPGAFLGLLHALQVAVGGSAVWADLGAVGSSGCSMLRVPWRLAVGVFVLFMACPEAKRGCLLVAASCKAGAKSLQIKMPLKVQHFTHPLIFFSYPKEFKPSFFSHWALPPTPCACNSTSWGDGVQSKWWVPSPEQCRRVALSELLPGDASCLPNALLFLLAVDLSPAGWCLCVGLALWSTVIPEQNGSGLFSSLGRAHLADCDPSSSLFTLADLNPRGLLFCS